LSISSPLFLFLFFIRPFFLFVSSPIFPFQLLPIFTFISPFFSLSFIFP
jgi:hypothetical protein